MAEEQQDAQCSKDAFSSELGFGMHLLGWSVPPLKINATELLF